MIKIEGLGQIQQFCNELDRAMLELDLGISRAFENWTKKIFHQLVDTTPQFTGNLAAAWNYSLHAPDYSYTPIPAKEENAAWSTYNQFEPRQRGDERATSIAFARADEIHPTWRDVVYFTNPAEIASWVEKHMIIIRPVNLVDGRVAMIQYYVDKFNRGELAP